MNVETRKMCIQAVRPTLFSATFNPDLLAVILTADFMSETFDGFAARARKAIRHPTTDQAMARLQQFVNARFYHALPREIARISGMHERETLTDEQDLEAHDYAMAIFEKRYQSLQSAGGIDNSSPYVYLSLGAFPKYVYPIADFVAAYAHRVVPNSPAALGVTCCADECILIAALAVKLGLCSLDDVVIMGSPVHYTLFLFIGDETFWFNAKRALITTESWAAQGGATAQAREETFLSMSCGYDRIVTPRGSYIFDRASSTLPPDHLVRIVDRISRFLGFERADLTAAAALPTAAVTRPQAPEVDQAMATDRPASDIDLLAKDTAPSDSIAALARYAHRSLDVPDTSIYADAARDSFRTYVQAARVESPEDAVALVRAVRGNRSILDGGSRIALPDEVLYFDTASLAERALLLYTLLAHSPTLPSETLQISLEAERAVVTYDDRAWDGADLLNPA